MPEPTTPAQELREAARLLLERAGRVEALMAGRSERATVIADALRPPLARELAAWLDSEAESYEVLGVGTQDFLAGDEGGDIDPAVAIARAYLGTPEQAAGEGQ